MNKIQHLGQKQKAKKPIQIISPKIYFIFSVLLGENRIS